MRDTATAFAASWPDENRAFRRGYTWDIPDRLPSMPPRRCPARTFDHMAAEIAADHRRTVRGRA